MGVFFSHKYIICCSIFVIFAFSRIVEAGSGVQTFGFTVLQANGMDESDANVYSQLLRKAIDDIGIYATLEFTDITLRLAEQNLPNSCVDPQCAIVAGQILGAHCFGFGTIGMVGKTFTISMQVVEVRTGKIIRDISEFYEGKRKGFINKIIPRFARRLSGIEKKGKRKKR
jgi:hypothetical protein